MHKLGCERMRAAGSLSNDMRSFIPRVWAVLKIVFYSQGSLHVFAEDKLAELH